MKEARDTAGVRLLSRSMPRPWRVSVDGRLVLDRDGYVVLYPAASLLGDEQRSLLDNIVRCANEGLL